MLQILVNHYNEDIYIVQRFLDSLEQQKNNIKLEVLIISDGGSIKLSQNLFNNYSFPIQYVYLKNNSGVCHTRNILLDWSTADYIMFCDIDDIFNNDYKLEDLLIEGKDFIGSSFYSEATQQLISYDIIHVHGKIFRRQYIIDNNIRFPDEMKKNGDMKFIWLAYALTDNSIWLNKCFYIWKNNPNSITHKNNENYNLNMLAETIQCYYLVEQEIKQRNHLDLQEINIIATVNMIYIYSTLMDWSKVSNKNKEKNYLAINNYLKEHYSFYKNINEIKRKEAYDNQFIFYQAPKYLYNFDKLLWWYEKQIKQTDTLIIGYNKDEKNLEKEIKQLNPDIYDKYNNYYWIPKDKKYKLVFICNFKEYDILELKNTILENEAEFYIIEDTISLETLKQIIQETNKHIISIFKKQNNIILNGDKEDCIQIQQILQKVYDKNYKFDIVDFNKK